MHHNILNEDQIKLLLLLAKFKREYYNILGEYYIASHIGHIVNLHQPHVRTIIRGKLPNKVNFGGKI